MPGWTTFWFETNSAWGRVDSPAAWLKMREAWNKGAHSMTPDEIYTTNLSFEPANPRPEDIPNFGCRAEHIGGKMSLGEFFDAHQMDRGIGAGLRRPA